MVSRMERTAFAAWWWTVDKLLLAALATLMLGGVILSLAASPPVAVRLGLDPFHFVNRQVLFLIPALLSHHLTLPNGRSRRLSLPLAANLIRPDASESPGCAGCSPERCAEDIRSAAAALSIGVTAFLFCVSLPARPGRFG